ncbi:hypothetical protein FEM48_Zijuj07G0071500 [Ziziphus jujuba var. spinosa]|uniref:Uncharacterized protein n=1 Tax=Ziziphus jujuba var. spinosa TaxID=714518 RepID=A0A978V375_ZIZJJ|nr:hypothetical protein FEM48_Zijuj07G0071000 [Ziziphus jujuba var. spinosa]KAH7521808.1 hypothetical protein FEM48_Zijuj07G0071500 [Ziziphus jujuba var. spinosa]
MNSDVVWSKFLRHDYHQVLSNLALASSMDSLSKKQLYFHLFRHHVLVDNGDMLSIIWGDTPRYWLWKSIPAESRSYSEWAASLQLCRDRGDGWMEVEMGEFFNDGGEDHGVVVFSLMEIDNYTIKSGLIAEGIKMRAKASRE